MKMTGAVTDLLTSALNDPEEPFTAELEETANGVVGCLSNVLASGASQANGTEQQNQSSLKVQQIRFISVSWHLLMVLKQIVHGDLSQFYQTPFCCAQIHYSLPLSVFNSIP